jgi:hypothetical protein
MKVIFNILLIVAALGAAYFSQIQSKKFEDQQAKRQDLVKKQTQVAATNASTEKDLKARREALTASRGELELAEAGVTALKSAETSLKRDVAAVDASLEAQKVELADLEKAVEEVNKAIAAAGGGQNVTADTVGDEVVKLQESLKTKTAKVEELKTLVDGAEKKIVSNRAESKRLSDRAVESSVRISRNAMEAVVTAVNQDWGFLVIGAGSNSGFTPQTSLLVQRDGKFIGRVKPTAIEATQTIADIDLDSLAAGVRIQPGDRVLIAVPSPN